MVGQIPLLLGHLDSGDTGNSVWNLNTESSCGMLDVGCDTKLQGDEKKITMPLRILWFCVVNTLLKPNFAYFMRTRNLLKRMLYEICCDRQNLAWNLYFTSKVFKIKETDRVKQEKPFWMKE